MKDKAYALESTKDNYTYLFNDNEKSIIDNANPGKDENNIT